MKVNLDCPVCGVCMETTFTTAVMCPICKSMFYFHMDPKSLKFTKERLKEKGIELSDKGIIQLEK